MLCMVEILILNIYFLFRCVSECSTPILASISITPDIVKEGRGEEQGDRSRSGSRSRNKGQEQEQEEVRRSESGGHLPELLVHTPDNMTLAR